MDKLRIIVFIGTISLTSSCATTTAIPIEGHRTYCGSVSSHCQDMGDTFKACEKIAPAGFYWEALPAEKSGDIFRCNYELRRLVPKSNAQVIEKPGCKSDQECKGNRICVEEQCRHPDK